jgi:hypothetical protein
MTSPHTGFALAATLTLLAACAAPPLSYDPDALESPARIIDKSVAGERTQPRADSYNAGPALAGVIGAAGLVLADALQKRTNIEVYEYVVRTNEGNEVSILSEYTGFSVGDCVKLFQSAQPTYPRIAPGGGCK